MSGAVDSRLDTELDGALRALAGRPRILLALDFDGVLAPIVPTPDAARTLPASAAALAELAGAPGVAVALVSGRSLGDLRRVAEPPPGVALVGSHGAESDLGAGEPGAAPPTAAEAALLARLRAGLAELVAPVPGAFVEDKPTAAVVHTRRADRGAAAALVERVLAGPASWPGVHARHGKEVVELTVRAASKGTALLRLRERLDRPGPGGVLYAGDDVTDEDAFAVLDDAAGDVTVKVGPGPTRARHRLDAPGAVSELLATLARLRRG